ncbi:MAG: hypothetical protein AB7N65_04380 [Vicinamibacterales bacterium]
MIVIRNTFIAKPGQAGKLVAQMKEVASAGNLKNVRFMTDLAGDFNQVIMEHEIESLADFEALMQRYASDPQIREKNKGYTDFWLTGKREIFRTV